MRRPALALFAALAVASTARAQSGPSAAIQAGTYDLEITFGGGVLEGRLDITIVGDSLATRLQVGGHDSPVRAGARRGNRLVLEPVTPGVQVRYELEFRGETVSGTFVYEGQEGAVAGRRRRPAGR